MSEVVNIHIKNNQNQNIHITVYDPATGAILQEDTLEISPNAQGLIEARSKVRQQYQDFTYTSEGFPEPDPPPELETERTFAELANRREDLTKPKVITKEDGSLAVEGHTVVSRTEAEVRAQVDAAVEEEIQRAEAEDQIDATQKEEVPTPKPGAPPDVVDQLNPFEFANFADGSAQFRADILQEYGEDLKNKFLIAGTDFSPSVTSQSLPSVRPKCAIDTDKEFRDKIEVFGITIRGNTYELDQMNSDVSKESKKLENLEVCENSADSRPEPAPPESIKPVVPRVKRAVQQEGISQEQKEKFENLSEDEKIKSSGTFGDHILDPVPLFRQAKTEKVISNRYNAWIVLGRDRTDNLGSGFGGRGHTQCGAIDICVGRMSPNPKSVDRKNEPVTVDPIFNTTRDPFSKGRASSPAMDAARIYLSQKTYVDQNFKLAPGAIGNNEEKAIESDSNPRSAIALKADGIRIMAREGIKLVTGVDGYNSQGGLMTSKKGVDIIAGNGQYSNSPVQPMVLGNNMVECVNDLSQILGQTVGAVQSIIKHIAILESTLATHVHITAGPGATAPSAELGVVCAASIAKLASVDTFSNAAGKWNINKWRYKYTRPGASKSIRSKYNNVN